jgi:8-oxo-dGTP diphosphatase
MREATLCFPVRGKPPAEVMLGLKKVGFGAGKYTGIGGKVEAGETIEETAVRELWEETGLRAATSALQKTARLTFYFPHRSKWDLFVHVFLVWTWQGEARESRELKPDWFPVQELPFASMWQDSSHWLPLVLDEQHIQATFIFGPDNETVAHAETKTWSPDKE